MADSVVEQQPSVTPSSPSSNPLNVSSPPSPSTPLSIPVTSNPVSDAEDCNQTAKVTEAEQQRLSLQEANEKAAQELAAQQSLLQNQEAMLREEQEKQEAFLRELEAINKKKEAISKNVAEIKLKSPELKKHLEMNQSDLRDLKTSLEAGEGECADLDEQINTITVKKTETSKHLAETKRLLQERQEVFKQTVSDEENLMRELKEISRLEAVEKQRIEDLNALKYNSAVKIECLARKYFARRRKRHKIFLRALDQHTRKNKSIQIQSQIRRYLATQHVAYLFHQKYLRLCLDSTVKIQCLARRYFSAKRVKFMRIDDANKRKRAKEIREETERLEAARLAREKEAAELEKFNRRQETLQKLADEKRERHFHILSRSTVLKRSKLCLVRASLDLPPSLACVSDIVVCLRRFPGDLSMVCDGIKGVLCCCKFCPTLAHFLLDWGFLGVIAKILEVHSTKNTIELEPEDGGNLNILNSGVQSEIAQVVSMIDRLNGYLSAAEDLTQAMPGAEVVDKQKLSLLQREMPLPENEFWERLGGAGSDGRINEEKSWEEVQIDEVRQDEKKDEFLDYSLSLENQSIISSLFLPDDAKPKEFDLSISKLSPPLIPPPPMNSQYAVHQQQASNESLGDNAKYNGNNVSGNNKSPHHVHTPYAIPLTKKKKPPKQKKRNHPKHLVSDMIPESFELKDEINAQQDSGLVRFEKSDELFYNDSTISNTRSEDFEKKNPASASNIVFQNSSSVFINQTLDLEEPGNSMLYFEEGTQVLVLEGRDGKAIKGLGEDGEGEFSRLKMEGGPVPALTTANDAVSSTATPGAESEESAIEQKLIQEHLNDQDFTLTDVYADAVEGGSIPGMSNFGAWPDAEIRGEISMNNNIQSKGGNNGRKPPSRSPAQKKVNSAKRKDVRSPMPSSQSSFPSPSPSPTPFSSETPSPSPLPSKPLLSKTAPKSKQPQKRPSSVEKLDPIERSNNDTSRANATIKSSPRSRVPTHGPTPKNLHQHKTVQKIFRNAAPPKIKAPSRFDFTTPSLLPLEDESSIPGTSSRSKSKVTTSSLGRRHSIRDMCAIFKVMDDNDSGTLPASKFGAAIVAMGNLKVTKPEVKQLLEDFGVENERAEIDYAEFASTGQIIMIKKPLNDSTGVPFTPWKNQILRPPPERSAHIEQTWENHVKWFNKRREHSIIWLVKRAVRAEKHIRKQRKCKRMLEVSAKKAIAALELADMGKAAFPNLKKMVVASRWLITKSKKARRHKLRQLEAHACLVQFVDFESTKKRLEKLNQRNYSQIYFLDSRKLITFKSLARIAEAARIAYEAKIKDVQWLHDLAFRAKAFYAKRIEVLGWLAERAERAHAHSDKQEKALAKLKRRAKKFKKLSDARVNNVIYFTARSERAAIFVTIKEDANAWLKNCGSKSKRYTVLYEEAVEFLRTRGYESKNFEQMVTDAREFLRNRVGEARRYFNIRNETQAELSKIGLGAKRHYAACLKAKKLLVQRTIMARMRKQEGDQAKNDLAQFVEDARVQIHRQFVSDAVPKQVKDMEKVVKAEDKEVHAARTKLSNQEKFREEMRDAFNYYDTSGDGAIDKIEFRNMLKDGSLLKVPAEEVDDCFSQIDKDKGGDIDFEEFFAWFNYEWSKDANGHVDKTGAADKRKKNFLCSKVISAKKRGINRLLALYEEGKLDDDFGGKLDKNMRGAENKEAGIGLSHIEGSKEDRWWLTAPEQLEYGGWEGYLERKAEKEESLKSKRVRMSELEIEQSEKRKNEDEKKAHQKEDLAHEDFEEHKADKLEAMKKKLRERAASSEA